MQPYTVCGIFSPFVTREKLLNTCSQEENDSKHRMVIERLDGQEQQKRDKAMAKERKAFMDVIKVFTNKLS